MGIDEDRVELTGSKLEKLLYVIRESRCGIVARDPNGEWRIGNRPQAGEYYECMPNGEVRLWSNNHTGTYQMVKQAIKTSR